MYNRREIMDRAWGLYRTCKKVTFADALRMAWREARMALVRYNVYGENIYNGRRELLLSNATDEAAQQCKWMNKSRYDIVEVRAA